MFRKERKERKEIPGLLKRLKIGRFTYDTWMKCNPDSNIHEWEESQKPYSLSLFVMSVIEKVCSKGSVHLEDLDTIQIVVLDENYIRFLEENKLMNSADTRALYLLDDDEANDILRKNKMDRDLQVMVIGVFVSSREKVEVIEISKETRDYIRDCLSDIYGEVWLPGYLMTAEDVENESERLMMMAAQHFENNREITISKYKELTLEGCDGTTLPIDFAFMPFVVKGTNQKACFSMEEFTKNLYEMHKKVGNEEKLKIENMLKHDFFMRNSMIFSYPVFPDQTTDLIKSYCKVLISTGLLGERQ